MCQGLGPKKHDEISEIDRGKGGANPTRRAAPRSVEAAANTYMILYVYLCVSLSLYIYIYICICVCIYIYIYMYNVIWFIIYWLINMVPKSHCLGAWMRQRRPHFAEKVGPRALDRNALGNRYKQLFIVKHVHNWLYIYIYIHTHIVTAFYNA